MPPRVQVVLNALALVVLGGAFVILVRFGTPHADLVATATQVASPAQPSTATTTIATPSKTPAASKPKVSPVVSVRKQPPKSTASTAEIATTSTDLAVRIENPYSTPPESSDAVNAAARAALVNILCLSRGSIRPISGSGVIIDPRGVILTNAHVAQYVLLSENPAINLSCVVRSGSPARAAWTASVLYMPPVWVASHAAKLNTAEAVGTGEHDYALLAINASTDGSGAPPALFPSLPFDARDSIGFVGDQVLAASYPAEFLGSIAAENALYAVSSISTIGKLLTFGEGTVDVISLGGIIEAQSGSSGGAVVNPWGRLIGLITTTSEGATTAERDLHALTLSYVNRDIAAQTGADLTAFLQSDLASKLDDFNTRLFPSLMDQYMAHIKPAQQ